LILGKINFQLFRSNRQFVKVAFG